ncbi:phasin family protein [Mesorhizobium sp. BR1-1-16]|uniref:phasin family protein n=1 Tax=Mesorhizobium sp. BR1-1-16 TaxID=2876653 RepID=UPI001CD0119E|nr:phasin family protein [Mesorhizobium sp. BR1-1-16]MBZ9934676.1 phasin family protein [Mesorhizobium sp. BR1-1-16]
MADETVFEIPEPMRAFADKSVDQARKAFDDFMSATVKAVDKAETSTKSIQEGARDVNRQAIGFLEENVAASFEFAQKLVRARTVEELQSIHRDFVQRQVAAAQAQTKTVGEVLTKVATDAAQKIKP